jgi:hypothetical protein
VKTPIRTQVAIALCLVARSAVATDIAEIPGSVQALITAQDTVLAMKSAKPFGNADGGTVVVVRHPLASDRGNDPCELIVLKDVGGQRVSSERNGKVVECTYNEANKSANARELDRNLAVSATEISFFNELPRGGTTYTFAWSSEKFSWHLQHVEATSVQNGDTGVVVYRSVLDYPSSLPWISLADFNPKLIRDSVAEHRNVVAPP